MESARASSFDASAGLTARTGRPRASSLTHTATLTLLAVAALLGLALLSRVEGARLYIALALVAVLSFANGANDVSKAVATLVGSGAAGYRRALAWGSLTTLVGARIAS